MSVGAFLISKLQNMERWLKENDCPVDMHAAAMPVTQVVAFAQELRATHGDAVKDRSFDAILEDTTLPGEILMTLAFVKNRPELHDKFWRYMALFSDTVSSDGR